MALFNWASSQKSRWLVVFDNADYSNALRDIEACFPHHNLGHIIITSRNCLLSRLASQNSKEVALMTEADSISLLLCAADVSEKSPEIISSAKAIVDILGCLPLAIDLAGAAIQTGLCSLSGYISLFTKSRRKILSSSIVQGASHYEQTVYSAFEVSFQEIQLQADQGYQGAQTALHLLEVFAGFHHENISTSIFECAAQGFADVNFEDDVYQSFTNVNQYLRLQDKYLVLDGTGKMDEYEFSAGVQVLLMFALVRSNQLTISIHPLVHGYLWDKMSINEQNNVTLISAAILSSYIDFGIRGNIESLWRELIPHVMYNMALLKDILLSNRYFDDLYSNYSYILSWNGEYEKAIRLRIQVLRERRTKLGGDHPDTLRSMGNLASTYWKQGRWSEAEALQMQVLTICKAKLGEDHPDTLRSRGNLACTYRNQGRWSEAEALEVQVMTIYQTKLGEDHPDTLNSMGGLACTHMNQGR